ncbi:MAG: ACT domain-containing protein [Desulfobacterales bacterium]
MEAEAKGKSGGATTKTILVEGIDQTGILFKISRYLADHNINIESLTSQRTTSPESDTALYLMEIVIQVSATISLEQLEKGLSQVGEDLNLEITIQ